MTTAKDELNQCCGTICDKATVADYIRTIEQDRETLRKEIKELRARLAELTQDCGWINK